MGARWDIFLWFLRNVTPRYSMHWWRHHLIMNLAFSLFDEKWGYELFYGSWYISRQKHTQTNISNSINFQPDLVQDMILLACETNWNHYMYLCIKWTFWRYQTNNLQLSFTPNQQLWTNQYRHPVTQPWREILLEPLIHWRNEEGDARLTVFPILGLTSGHRNQNSEIYFL